MTKPFRLYKTLNGNNYQNNKKKYKNVKVNKLWNT